MSQYDPMGRKNPLTIILKINLKNLFAPDTKLGRDDVIPPGFCKTWVDILTTFLRMGEITLSRAVKSERTVGRPIIIRFADGSLDANGCSIYIWWELDSDGVSGDQWYFIRLVCGKARVTSVKGTTVLRSEFSGLHILSRLLKVVSNAMDVKPSTIYVSVDS